MPYLRLYALLIAAVLLTTVAEAIAEPRRPASNWNQCTPSGDQLNRLTASNPGAMQTCQNMASAAQARGGSFAFMCDADGNVACCDENSCVQVGRMGLIRPNVPGIRAPESGGILQSPGTQPPRTMPGTVQPGMIMPRGIEGDQSSEPSPGVSTPPEQPTGTKPQ